MRFKGFSRRFKSLRHSLLAYTVKCMVVIVQEPVIGLIKWLRPKGLKVCSYVEKCAVFKNQTLKKVGWYTKVLCTKEYPRGMQYLKIALKWGYHCRFKL